MIGAFRQPQFGRIYAGTAAFMLGDSILLVVLSMWVKTLTGSNSQAGLTFLFTAAPALLAPAMGNFLDRIRRKPVMVWGNVAAALLVTPLVLVSKPSHVWIIWVVAFWYGCSMIVLPATLNGLLKTALPEQFLSDANASLQTTKQALRLFGPLVGAALFAIVDSIWPIVAIDVAAFLVAAAIFSTVRVDEHVDHENDASVLEEMLRGVRFVRFDGVLGPMVLGIVLMTAVIGFYESSIYAMLDGFDQTTTAAAYVVTCQGTGAVVAGMLTSTIIRHVGEVTTLVLGMVLLAASTAVTAALTLFTWVLALAVVMGAGLPLITVAINTLIQVRTPQRLMTRVSMVVEVLATGPQALSLGVGALLVLLLDWRTIFGTMSLFTALGAALIAVRLRTQIRLPTTLATATGRTAHEPEPTRRR